MNFHSLSVLSLLLFSLGSSLTPIKGQSSSLTSSQLKQFNVNDWDSVGISDSSVCDGDYSVSGYSCVTADLKALNFSPVTLPLQYHDSRIITLADDREAAEVFLYVYRIETDRERDYSKASISLQTSAFDSMHMIGEDLSLFKNYDIDPVSMSADFSLVKYRISGLADLVNWESDEREYIVRELIDWQHKEESSAIMPSGINFGVRNNPDGTIEVVQNSLNCYEARQQLVESYIHIADKGDLPLNYDSRIQGQSILLFDIYKNDELFLNRLRSVELQASFYQWYGATNLPLQNNAERGKKVVEQMIASQWKSGTAGTLPENFHVKEEAKNASLIIEPASHEIDYKPNLWHWWKTRKYFWNDLDYCKNFDQANKHVDGSLLDSFTYYAVLKTFDFEISPTAYTSPSGSYWQIADRSDGYLPYVFSDVSLGSFWYEEGTKVKQGIVMSTFNDSYGTVQLVAPKAKGWSTWLIVVAVVAAVIVIGIILKFASILKDVFLGLLNIIKGLFIFITWPIRAIFHKLCGD